jgi:hypothetical protein
LRARRDLADALAAELTDIADTIADFLTEASRDEIPLYYRTSDTVFQALVGQLGELPYEDVVAIARYYRFLEEYNRLPKVWHERANRALELPHNHPFREAELPDLQKGAAEFYRVLEGMHADAKNLATFLRTKHSLGWRTLLPRRFRPKMKLYQSLERSKADA